MLRRYRLGSLPGAAPVTPPRVGAVAGGRLGGFAACPPSGGGRMTGAREAPGRPRSPNQAVGLVCSASRELCVLGLCPQADFPTFAADHPSACVPERVESRAWKGIWAVAQTKFDKQLEDGLEQGAVAFGRFVSGAPLDGEPRPPGSLPRWGIALLRLVFLAWAGWAAWMWWWVQDHDRVIRVSVVAAAVAVPVVVIAAIRGRGLAVGTCGPWSSRCRWR